MSISVQHIETLVITPDVLNQWSSGVDPEALKDIGYSLPEDLPDAPVQDEPPTHEEEAELQIARAEQATPSDPRIKPYSRKAHLLKAMQTAAKLRMYRGGITTSQPTTIFDMGTVEDRLESAETRLKESLVKACADCAFRGQCKLEGKPDAWLDAHPTKPAKVTRKTQQSFPEFKESLDLDPMANCVPTKNTHHKRVLARR